MRSEGWESEAGKEADVGDDHRMKEEYLPKEFLKNTGRRWDVCVMEREAVWVLTECYRERHLQKADGHANIRCHHDQLTSRDLGFQA